MEEKNLKELIWDIFNYSTFYIVVFDKEMKIMLANYYLAKELGFESEGHLVGKYWYDFIPASQKIIVENISKDVCSGKTPFKEYPGETIDRYGKTLHIRWFSTFVDNHVQCTFNIGIPLQESRSEDGIESIRSFYKDILEKDSKMIQAMKESIVTQIPTTQYRG